MTLYPSLWAITLGFRLFCTVPHASWYYKNREDPLCNYETDKTSLLSIWNLRYLDAPQEKSIGLLISDNVLTCLIKLWLVVLLILQMCLIRNMTFDSPDLSRKYWSWSFLSVLMTEFLVLFFRRRRSSGCGCSWRFYTTASVAYYGWQPFCMDRLYHLSKYFLVVFGADKRERKALHFKPWSSNKIFKCSITHLAVSFEIFLDSATVTFHFSPENSSCLSFPLYLVWWNLYRWSLFSYVSVPPSPTSIPTGTYGRAFCP